MPNTIKKTDTEITSFETEVKALIDTQRKFFYSNATKPVSFRIAQLKKLKQLLKDNEAQLHKAIYADLRKSEFDNLTTELLPLYSEIDYAVKNLKKWATPKRVKTTILNFPSKSYIVAEPLGVSLIIGAWNFPYNIALIPIVGAIAAGNTSILKPSEMAPATSAIMAELINKNFPSNYLKVLQGGIPETTAILKQRFDKIFFTGSPQVGKIVNQAAAPHLTNVTLELGGKNPAIFTKDCSLNIGVKRMVSGKFLNAGQICITSDYVLVQKDIKEKFLTQVVAEIKKQNYSIENGNFVELINDKNFDRIVSLIDSQKVYYGGNYIKETRFIEPTILTNVSVDDAVMQEEIFGPVLPVIEYDTIDEAFAIIQKFEKPLSAYLFSNNSTIKKRFLNEVSFGNGAINDSIMQFTNHNLPFGGVGNSGTGSYHGKFSFDCFSHAKSILSKSTWIEANLKYYEHTDTKMKIIKKLF
ncbi:aldehyde dehydrogenase [Aquimarina agarilytica]|uniref:aldehyde dehydrogenase n=1 Tax=Aquimarina agarilytica TaxID=1087449 RepID=UPI000287D016|nr:aldehyde dehydrogenase [Aquimarina agarilytica]